MPTKMALWSARRMRRQAGADQRMRWNMALVPNMASMANTYTPSAALLPEFGAAAMSKGPPMSQATKAPTCSQPRSAGRSAVVATDSSSSDRATAVPSNTPGPVTARQPARLGAPRPPRRRPSFARQHPDVASRRLSSPTPVNRMQHGHEDRSCDQAGADHEVSNDRGGSTLEEEFGHPNRRVGRIYVGGRSFTGGQ